MFMLSRYLVLVVVLVCLLLNGCSSMKDMGRTLGNLGAVQSELVKKFGDKNVQIRANSFRGRTDLIVTFINSPINQKSRVEQFKRAEESAAVVKTLYPDIKKIHMIVVQFAAVKTALVLFHSTRVLDTFVFDNQGKSLQPSNSSEPSSIDPSAPLTHYTPSENRTDISSQGILLEGTPEKGLTLVPHFSVAGNINGRTPQPPNEVSMDFASFADEQKFPNATRVLFITNGKLSYQATGQFTTSKLADGLYSEFLYLKMPTKAFINLTSGDHISVKLEHHTYELDDRCVLQMQRMSDYLK